MKYHEKVYNQMADTVDEGELKSHGGAAISGAASVEEEGGEKYIGITVGVVGYPDHVFAIAGGLVQEMADRFNMPIHKVMFEIAAIAMGGDLEDKGRHSHKEPNKEHRIPELDALEGWEK